MMDAGEVPVPMLGNRPCCEWTGIAEDGWEAYVCGRPATEVVRDLTGHIHYACPEHLASIRAKAGPGSMLHRAHPAIDRVYIEVVA